MNEDLPSPSETTHLAEPAVGIRPPPNQSPISLPAATTYDLIKIQVLEDCKEELASWGKKRFWLITFALAAVGFFGGVGIVERIIEQEIDQKVGKQVGELRDSTLSARIEAEIVKRRVSETLTENKGMSQQLSELKERLEASDGRIASLTERTDRFDEVLQQMESRVQNSSDELDDHRELASALKTRGDELGKELRGIALSGESLRVGMSQLTERLATTRSNLAEEKRAAGVPVLRQISSRDRNATILGANFGSTKGSVKILGELWYTRISRPPRDRDIHHDQIPVGRGGYEEYEDDYEERQTAYSMEAEMGRSAITSWSAGHIEVIVKDKVRAALEQELKERADISDSWVRYRMKIRSFDGKTSGWSEYVRF